MDTLDESFSDIYDGTDPVIVTIPQDSIEVGAVRSVIQKGPGPISVAAGANVTISGTTETSAPMNILTLWQHEPNIWVSIPSGPEPSDPDPAPHVLLLPALMEPGEIVLYKGET